MDAITTERLRHVLESAATLPIYRDRFYAAGLLEKVSSKGFALATNWQSAFFELQPIDRATVQSQSSAFLATATDVVYRGITSGTQGQPLIYFAGAAWNQARLEARQRSLLWWGITDRVPILNVASRLFPLRSTDGAIAGILTPQFIDQLLQQLAHRPTALRGYPSRLCEVAVQLSHTRLPPVVAVICTGECLFEQQRSLLEQVFCAPVVNEYGCQETGISGLTCPEGGRLHLDGDYPTEATASHRCLYEHVNGQWVTTDLLNRTMPMVRYQCGDELAIDSEPCLCGRPGLTARILGRTEDRVDLQQGNPQIGCAVPVGAVSMPALTGIHHYRVIQQDASHLILHVQPDSSFKGLDQLVAWTQNTFGEVKAQVVVEPVPVLHSTAIAECDASTWIEAVTQGSWAQWLKQSVVPIGSAQTVAQLWRELVNPQVLMNEGLSCNAQSLLQAVLNSPTDCNAAIETIKARVLLLACSSLATDPAADTTHANLNRERDESEAQTSAEGSYNSKLKIQNSGFDRLSHLNLKLKTQNSKRYQMPQATQVYQQAIARLDSISSRTEPVTLIDRLIPALYLPNSTSIWTAVEFDIATLGGNTLDTFTIHHLLQALETATQQAIAQRRIPLLRPLLSVLVSDFRFFAPHFGVWLLAHWCEWLHGQVIPYSVAPPTDGFAQAWLTWRQGFTEHTTPAIAPLLALEAAARSPLEQARVALERGYYQLWSQQPLDPEEWLAIVQTYGVMEGSQNGVVNPVAWAPILRALSISLMAIDQRDLAYQCLVAATVPSSKVSAFERLAAQVNGKQVILGKKGNR